MSQQYTPLSSPKGQGPAGPRLGSEMCLWTQFCRLQYCSFLTFGIGPLVDEAGLEFCAGFLAGGGWWVELDLGPLVGKALLRFISRGGCGLKKTIGSLSANGGGLGSNSVGCLA